MQTKDNIGASQPVRVRRPKRQEIRQRVIEGAFDAFAERGFMGASVDFICLKAGLSRGAFYSNFGDKEELFLALYDRQAAFLTDRIRQAAKSVSECDQPMELLAVLIGGLGDDEQRWDIISKEFVIHALRNEQARERLNHRRAQLRADISVVLRSIFASIGRDVPADIDDYARIAVAIYEGNMTQRGLEPERSSGHSLMTRFLPAILKFC